MGLSRYSKGISKRLFEILDRTKEAMEQNDEYKLLEISKMMETLAIEIKGAIVDFELLDRGHHILSVSNILLGLKSVPDYNVRRKAIKDCLSIVHRVTQEALKSEDGGVDA